MSKTVLITGGAQRLGAEIVHCFARAGWKVWCHYQRSAIDAQALIQQICNNGGDAKMVSADLAQFSEIEQMMHTIKLESGPVDAVVNNASMFEPDAGTSFTPQMAQAQLNVNLLAPMYIGQLVANQHAAKRDSAEADPCIIHILDQKVFNLNPDYFSYTLSKLALERAVALQAQALAPNIRVCAVAPGLMYRSGPQSVENFDLAGRVNLLEKVTAPENVAKACLFLATKE